MSRYLVIDFMTSLSKIDSPTRQLISPERPASATPAYDQCSSCRVTLRHGYHSDSTATTAAAASSPSFANAHNYEAADGVAYRGLIALASLSMAISDGKEGLKQENSEINQLDRT